jgi:SNF2 family DNA or RNA helicase
VIIRRYSDKQKDMLVNWIPGARWSKTHLGFKAPADMQTLQLLRRKFGDKILFSNELLDWARQVRAAEAKMHEIVLLEDSELPVFSEYNPAIYEMMRPDQRVGVRWLADGPGGLIADDPGLGKTWQVIASVIESGQLEGPQLVVCPKISIQNVWLKELNLLQEEPVFVAEDGRLARDAMFRELTTAHEEGWPFWLVINWSMVTLRDGKPQFPILQEIDWNTVIVDEAHLTGMANHSSMTAQGLIKLKAGKRIAMTGTPMGGKPMRLWGILHWLDQHEFSNSYQWADRWVDITMGIAGRGTENERKFTQYRGISKKKEEAFAKAHAKYILRRTKAEVFTELLPPVEVEVWVDMLPKQAKQYKEMEEKARVTIEEQEEITGHVNVTTMLATYAWLKQFADGYCDLQENGFRQNPITGQDEIRYKALPTAEASPKLDAIWAKIQELDIDEDSGEKLLIFSQFRGWIDLVHSWLKAKGIAVDKITGAVKSADRDRIQADFQNPEGYLKVVCLTTKAAGVSINLDMADNVIFMDETWDPDDQTQAWSRAHRASRIHLVTVTYLRTNKSIEQEVKRTTDRKKNINDILLDKYRLSKGEETNDQ